MTRSIFLCCFVLLSLIVQASASSKIMDRPIDQLATFYWTAPKAGEVDLDSIQKVIDANDPYQIFYFAFRALRYSYQTGNKQMLAEILKRLDYMIDQYQPAVRVAGGIRWRYAHPFNEIPPNWWSAMDGFLGPMTLYAAWEATGIEKYKTAAIKSALLTIQSPTEGGSMWHEDSSCWISEFSWPGITIDKEYRVTNGQMVGLQALYILAEASGNAQLLDAYKCARRGAELHEDEFAKLNPGDWPWYRINPPTILPINYLLFEANEYDSMAAATGDDFFSRQAKRRKDLFAARYPLTFVDSGTKKAVITSFVGPPHPYLSQSYPTKISCETDSVATEAVHRSQLFEDKAPLERFTNVLDVTGAPTQCTYSIIRGDFTYPVFTQHNFPIAQSAPRPAEAAINPSLDAIAWDGKVASISPAFLPDKVNKTSALNDEARLTLSLKWTGKTDLLAMILRPDIDTSVQFLATDAAGEYSYRVYPEAAAGCENIIILAKEGFNRSEKLADTITQVALRLGDSPAWKDYKVELKDIAYLENAAQVREYFSRHPDACFQTETLLHHSK